MKWQSLERAANVLGMKVTTLRRRAERARQREPLEHMWRIAPGVWAQRMLGGRWFVTLEPEIDTESQSGSANPLAIDAFSLVAPRSAGNEREKSLASRSNSSGPTTTRSKSPKKNRTNLQ